MKRILSILVSVVIILGLVFVPASASSVPTVTVQTVSEAVKPGDTVTLDVAIANNPGFTNFQWTIDYDTSKLELKAINTFYVNEDDDDVYYISGANVITNVAENFITCAKETAFTKDNRTLFTLTFNVKTTAAAGDAEVKIATTAELHKFENGATDPITTIDATYVAGGVTVAAVHTCDNGEPVEGKAATCTADGWNGYYKCSCNKLYADADCQNEITDLNAWKTGAGKIEAGHTYGELIAAKPAVHTQTELEGAVAAHYFCDVCGGYFTEGKVATTLEALTGAKPSHSYGEWVNTDAEAHWKECSCGLKDQEGAHNYDNDADATCNDCSYVRTITDDDTTGGSSTGGSTTGGSTTGGSTIGGSTTGGSTTGGSTTGGSTTGGSTTGGSTTGGSTTGGSTTGGSTTGGSTTGGSTTGGSTTGGSTTGGSTTGGSTTGGSTTGGSTTGGSTTGGSTTGGSTTGGSTTGGSTTGGSTTGGSTTGGSTTGGSTTGGSTTGGSTTGGSTTGGSTTGGSTTGGSTTGGSTTGGSTTGGSTTGGSTTGGSTTGGSTTGGSTTGGSTTGGSTTGGSTTGGSTTGGSTTGGSTTGGSTTGGSTTGGSTTGGSTTGGSTTGGSTTGGSTTGGSTTGGSTTGGSTTGGSTQPHSHVWGETTYTWAEDGSSCTAKRVCTEDETHIETATATITSAEKIPATETVKGTTTYTATFTEDWATTQTKDVQNIPVQPHSHVWGETTYTWAADGSSCTAKRVCTKDETHIETATATITSAEKIPATETVKGTTTYTATFTEDWATTQTKDVQDIPVTPPAPPAPSAPSGGSGGGATYKIVAAETENGSVALSHLRATRNTLVTITATPDAGSKVLKVTVTRNSNGAEITVAAVDNTKYTFRMPNDSVTVTVTFQSDGSTSSCSCSHLVDVDRNQWYHAAVDYVVSNGMMGGIGEDMFAPNATMERAMVIQVLYNMEKNPAVSYTGKFSDVPSGKWYTNAIEWGVANHLISGYGEVFKPAGNITREEVATILYNYAKFKGMDVSARGDLSVFSDGNTASAWAKEFMQWAVGSGLMIGGGGRLNPTGNATRAEMAQMFKNFNDIFG